MDRTHVVDLEPYRAAGVVEKLRRVLGFRPIEAIALVVAPLIALLGVIVVAFVIEAEPLLTALLVFVFCGPAALSGAELGAFGWLWSRWAADAIAFTDALLDVARLAGRDAERVQAGGLVDPEELEPFLRSVLNDILAPLLDEALTAELGKALGFVAGLYARFLVRTVERAIPSAVRKLAEEPERRRALAKTVGATATELEPMLERVSELLVEAERRLLVLRVFFFAMGCLLLFIVAFGPLFFLHGLGT